MKWAIAKLQFVKRFALTNIKVHLVRSMKICLQCLLELRLMRMFTLLLLDSLTTSFKRRAHGQSGDGFP